MASLSPSHKALHSIERAPRTPPSIGTLVLLHGYGANEEDLLTLADALDPRLHAVGLRAPLELPWGGHAWYPLVPRGEGIDFDSDEVDAAIAQASGEVEALARRDGKAPVLLGFSQGGGVALSLALQRPDLARAVLAFSAVPPMVAAEKRASRERLRALPVFAAHGTRDELLPIVLGRSTRARLEEAGCPLEWHEYPIGHEVGLDEIRDARAFVSKLF